MKLPDFLRPCWIRRVSQLVHRITDEVAEPLQEQLLVRGLWRAARDCVHLIEKPTIII